jgi:catechol 2,3-dioxygenase-like lactoylglutathione lyase family enzyme
MLSRRWLRWADRTDPKKTVKPRITLITLGVDDLPRALAFYRDGLEWPTQGIVGEQFENGAVAFFDLANGLRLALWPRHSLASDAGLPLSARASTDFALAHNVATRDEVDDVMQLAQRAGATIAKPAQSTFYGGYAGYFQDPDGHLWEVAFNPDLLPTD